MWTRSYPLCLPMSDRTAAKRTRPRTPASPAGERVHKVLARAGLASRREIESWIEAGRIRLNGKPAGLGDLVNPTDRIEVDGELVDLRATTPLKTRVLAYYKEAGEVCTRKDPEGRPTIFAKLPRIRRGQWVAIGRLDLNTTGLILFTTNGELAHRLMHPSREVEREYSVRVLGQASPAQIQNLLRGVMLADGPAAFSAVREIGGTGVNRWYSVILKEGRNREVRRLWESQGLTVSRLIRTRYGPCSLLRWRHPGQFWDLEKNEFAELLAAAGLHADAPHARGRTTRSKPAAGGRTTRSKPATGGRTGRAKTDRPRRRPGSGQDG